MHAIRQNHLKVCSACNLPFNTLKVSPCCRKTFCDDCTKIHDMSDVCVIAECRPKNIMTQSQITEKTKTSEASPVFENTPRITLLARFGQCLRQPAVVKTSLAACTFFIYSLVLLNFNQSTKCKLF